MHERFRTESHSQAAARFNERFLLSIASCKACVVMDDELNILPISSHMKFIQPVTNNEVWVHQFYFSYWYSASTSCVELSRDLVLSVLKTVSSVTCLF